MSNEIIYKKYYQGVRDRQSRKGLSSASVRGAHTHRRYV